MAHHNVGEHSPFLKRILVPFWVMRIVIMVINVGLLALIIGAFAYVSHRRSEFDTQLNDLQKELDALKSDYNVDQTITAVIAILSVQMVLILICLVGDMVCIIKRSRRTLTPKFFLAVNISQTVFWLVSSILAFLGARTASSIGVTVFVLMTFVGMLIYASIVFHQWRTGKLPAPVEGHQMASKYHSEVGYDAPQAQYGAPAKPSMTQHQ